MNKQKRASFLFSLILLFIFSNNLHVIAQDDPLVIDENGKIGIGTTTPNSDLHVAGDVQVDKNLTTQSLTTKGNTTVEGKLTAKSLSVNDNFTAGKLAQINGNLNVQGNLKVNGFGLTPQYAIIMYSGGIHNFDSSGKGKDNTNMEGWAICNGKNGTPNLQERFIVGVNLDNSKYALRDTGGMAAIKLTIDEIPSHSHTMNAGRITCSGTGCSKYAEIIDVQYAGSNGSTNQTGGGLPHENRPPYYALYYIMKL